MSLNIIKSSLIFSRTPATLGISLVWSICTEFLDFLSYYNILIGWQISGISLFVLFYLCPLCSTVFTSVCKVWVCTAPLPFSLPFPTPNNFCICSVYIYIFFSARRWHFLYLICSVGCRSRLLLLLETTRCVCISVVYAIYPVRSTYAICLSLYMYIWYSYIHTKYLANLSLVGNMLGLSVRRRHQICPAHWRTTWSIVCGVCVCYIELCRWTWIIWSIFVYETQVFFTPAHRFTSHVCLCLCACVC